MNFQTITQETDSREQVKTGVMFYNQLEKENYHDKIGKTKVSAFIKEINDMANDWNLAFSRISRANTTMISMAHWNMVKKITLHSIVNN